MDPLQIWYLFISFLPMPAEGLRLAHFYFFTSFVGFAHGKKKSLWHSLNDASVVLCCII